MRFRSIFLASLLMLLPAGCSTTRPQLPPEPEYETVPVLIASMRDETGAVLKETWVIRDPAAWLRNEEKSKAYQDALRIAAGESR